MEDTAPPEVIAMLGATVAVATAEMLVVKGVLTEDEILMIFSRSIESFADPQQRVQAVQALQALVPGLRVEPKTPDGAAPAAGG